MNPKPFIQVENLSYAYPLDDGARMPAVRNVSFTVYEGEFVAVLGHNGSGKSTLAKLLNMILIPDEGKITIDGVEITHEDLTEDALYDIRRKIGMVFQNPDNQIVATIVEEDVAFGPENLGIPPAEIRRRVDWALDTVGMRAYARHAPHKLSGGQKQRVAIAGIIAMMPQCIVFDESTAMLDPLGRREVMCTIERLNRENGITVLHITHDMSEAVRADRVMVMQDGEIYMEGAPSAVFTEVEKIKAAGLDVPQTTELLYMLSGKGFTPLPLDAFDAEACADAIAAYYYAHKEKINDGN